MTSPKPQTDVETDATTGNDAGRWISALVDGEPDALDPACRHWRDDPSARRSWHAYHLIGDVLRSDELARAPARDAAFIAALRDRLAAEPVPLAPTVAAAPRRRQPWLMPAAVAAGVFVVAGVLVFGRFGAAEAPAPVFAGSDAGDVTTVADRAATPAPVPAGGFIRDPRLDEYLRAHRSALGGVAAAAPGGMLRRVDNDLTAGAPR